MRVLVFECTVAVHSPYVHVATIEYEAELRHKNEMARVAAEIQGKYELVCTNLFVCYVKVYCLYSFYIVHDTAT